MADHSKIEWTDATWNPIRGCTRVSPGCGGPGSHGGCYAEAIAARFSGPGQAYEGIAEMQGGKPRWTGKLSFGHDLDAPLRWRRPRRIFVNSMSDLFHEGLSVSEIATVYAVCVAAFHLRGHVSQILTKRGARMRAVLADPEFWEQVNAEAEMHVLDGTDPLSRRSDDARATLGEYGPNAPPPGIWLGVSTEDQQRANEQVPALIATPAAVRFVSAEPLLGLIDFRSLRFKSGDNLPEMMRVNDERGSINALSGISTWPESHYQSPTIVRNNRIIDGELYTSDGEYRRLDWIIVGGESGPNARPMHPAWARAIRDQCAAAGVSFFMKQMTKKAPIPDDLMVREMPNAA